jgi:hypothetical protein
LLQSPRRRKWFHPKALDLREDLRRESEKRILPAIGRMESVVMAFSRKLLALGLLLTALPASSTLAVTVDEEPLPRVEDRLCPGVIGMQVESALTVLDRVRANAARLGIRLADPDSCTPNLLIAFVPDPSASLNRLMDDAPRLFREESAAKKRSLRSEMGPALAWNVIRTKTRDGIPVTRREGLVDVPEARMWSAHSKIYTPTREDIVSTVILFDSQEMDGTTLKQLADYVSMRAFASDYSSYREASGNSILTLFSSGDARPAELTEADMTFLDSLYSGMANIPGSAKEREIENEAGG